MVWQVTVRVVDREFREAKAGLLAYHAQHVLNAQQLCTRPARRRTRRRLGPIDAPPLRVRDRCDATPRKQFCQVAGHADVSTAANVSAAATAAKPNDVSSAAATSGPVPASAFRAAGLRAAAEVIHQAPHRLLRARQVCAYDAGGATLEPPCHIQARLHGQATAAADVDAVTALLAAAADVNAPTAPPAAAPAAARAALVSGPSVSAAAATAAATARATSGCRLRGCDGGCGSGCGGCSGG
eukprot:361128-Chlamydomonas_euryale.AAC.1